MPLKLKKLRKTKPEDTAQVDAVHVRYFQSIGLACESGLKHGTPEFRAAFMVKFGTPTYRAAAWLRVRDQVNVPDWVHEMMNEHFAHGPATHFTHGFSLADRQRMKSAIA